MKMSAISVPATWRYLSSLLVFLQLAFTVVVLASEAGSEQGEVQHVQVVFTDSEIRRIKSMGPWPGVVPPDPGNELSGLAWAETLGEQLFFNQSLSGTGQISCASCHLPERGFSDGLKVATGIDQHVRNSPGLLNIGLQRWFGWDGGADSLWAASLRPLLSGIEMGGDVAGLAASLRKIPAVIESLTQHLAETRPDEIPDEDLLVFASKAIGAYSRTLRSAPTPFDRYREALVNDDRKGQLNYSISAKRGLKTFIGDANCRACHFGANFSNGEFHDIGRPFFTGVGQVDPGRHSGIKRVRQDPYNLAGKFNGTNNKNEALKVETVTLGQVNFGQWRTPSLRNLTLTAPYMHDGSLATLRDVVDFYAEIDTERLHAKGESILKPLQLDDDARQDLVNFLESLTPLQ